MARVKFQEQRGALNDKMLRVHCERDKKSRAEKMRAQRKTKTNQHSAVNIQKPLLFGFFQYFSKKSCRKHSGRFSVQPLPGQNAFMHKQGHIEGGCAARRFVFMRRSLLPCYWRPPTGLHRKETVALYCTLLHFAFFEPSLAPSLVLLKQVSGKCCAEIAIQPKTARNSMSPPKCLTINGVTDVAIFWGSHGYYYCDKGRVGLSKLEFGRADLPGGRGAIERRVVDGSGVAPT